MILPITKLPAEVLRRETEAVMFPLNKAVKRLLKDMLDTVKKADGIGLAAPQVGSNLNAALIYLEQSGVPAFFIFNPTITEYSKETAVIEEGCLSMPGVFGEVARPKKITVTFQDAEGKPHTLTDDGWLARVIQHEYDHLHKTLIIDKMRKVTVGKELLPNYQ